MGGAPNTKPAGAGGPELVMATLVTPPVETDEKSSVAGDVPDAASTGVTLTFVPAGVLLTVRSALAVKLPEVATMLVTPELTPAARPWLSMRADALPLLHATDSAEAMPLTATGVDDVKVVPSPSCPATLWPQHLIEPVARMAQLCRS